VKTLSEGRDLKELEDKYLEKIIVNDKKRSKKVAKVIKMKEKAQLHRTVT
jgi:hypothetical protein